jgi:acyl carrier protein
MNQDKITDRDAKLYEIVRAVLELPSDTDISRVRQLSVDNWDSLAHVSLMLAIEGEFGVTVDIADQIALTSVPAIRLFLEERGL